MFRRNRATPAPVIAAPPTKPPQTIENPQVPPPPKVEQAETPTVAPKVATQIPAKPPPKPRPPRPAPRRQAPVAKVQVPPPAEQQAPVSATAPPQPVLSQVLSPAQQEAFNKAIDQAIQEVESRLAPLAAKPMNATQQANADRARSFVAQAQQTRTTDLATAKTLADRAVVLAQSLSAELR